MVNDAIKDAELVASNSAEVAELRRSFYEKLEKEGPPKPGRNLYTKKKHLVNQKCVKKTILKIKIEIGFRVKIYTPLMQC